MDQEGRKCASNVMSIQHDHGIHGIHGIHGNIMGWGTFVEDTFVESTFVEGTLVEMNIGRTEHWSNGT